MSSLVTTVMVAISKLVIRADMFQMRVTEFGRTQAQIVKEGIDLDKLQPLICVKASDLDGTDSDLAVIADGHSRYAGAKGLVEANATIKIPAELLINGEVHLPVRFVTKEAALVLSATMNESRDSHTDFESGRACAKLFKAGRTLSAIGILMGKSQGWVRTHLYLSNICVPLAREILTEEKGVSVSAAKVFGRMAGDLDLGSDLQMKIWAKIFKPLRSERTGGISEATMKRYCATVQGLLKADPSGGKLMELADEESSKLADISAEIVRVRALIALLESGKDAAANGWLVMMPELESAIETYATKDQIDALKGLISTKKAKKVA